MKENQTPVKHNQKIKIKITSIGRKGDGIAKYNGFIIVIPKTQINQEYEVQITDIHQTYAFAIRTDLIQEKEEQ